MRDGGRRRPGHRLLVFFVLLSLCLLLPGCGRRKKTENGGETERSLSYGPEEMLLVMLSARARTEAVYTDQIWSVRLGEKGESYEEAFGREMHSFFEELCAMDGIAGERDVRLDKEEQTRLQDAAHAFFDTSVRGDGRFGEMTEERLFTLFRDYALALKLKKTIAESREAEVPESEARVIRLELVRTDDPDIAETIRMKVLEGGDLYDLAQTYAASRGVPVKAGPGDLPEDVEKEVFSLEEGEISSVHVRDGMYCVYRLASAYDEAETRKRRLLLQEERLQALISGAYRDYMRKHEVLVDEESFRQALDRAAGPYGGADFFDTVEGALSDEGVSL